MSKTEYTFYVGIGLAGCTREETFSVEDLGFSEEEWKDMDDDEKEELLSGWWDDWHINYIDGGWE